MVLHTSRESTAQDKGASKSNEPQNLLSSLTIHNLRFFQLELKTNILAHTIFFSLLMVHISIILLHESIVHAVVIYQRMTVLKNKVELTS